MTQDDNAPVADETAATDAINEDAGQDAGKAETEESATGKAAPDAEAVGKDGKAIWVGSAAVGIGSAALVAALMYARRRK